MPGINAVNQGDIVCFDPNTGNPEDVVCGELQEKGGGCPPETSYIKVEDQKPVCADRLTFPADIATRASEGDLQSITDMRDFNGRRVDEQLKQLSERIEKLGMTVIAQGGGIQVSGGQSSTYILIDPKTGNKYSKEVAASDSNKLGREGIAAISRLLTLAAHDRLHQVSY